MRVIWLFKDHTRKREYNITTEDGILVKLPPDLRGFLNEPFEALQRYIKNWSFGFPPTPKLKPSPPKKSDARPPKLDSGHSIRPSNSRPVKKINPVTKLKKGKRRRFW